jgi:hypothetical protein
MKKHLFMYSIAVLLVSISACNKVRDALMPAIDVDLPAFQFPIPAIPFVLPNEASLGSFTTTFNMDSIIRANTGGAFGAGAVSTIKVKQITIGLLNGDALNNLSNFESARFTFYSNTKSTPVEIFNVVFPDTFSTSLTVNPENSPELKEYLKGTQLTYTLYGRARRVTTKALTFNIQVTLSAK